MIIKKQTEYNILYENLKDAKAQAEKWKANITDPKKVAEAEEKMEIISKSEHVGWGNLFIFIPLVLDFLKKDKIDNFFKEIKKIMEDLKPYAEEINKGTEVKDKNSLVVYFKNLTEEIHEVLRAIKNKKDKKQPISSEEAELIKKPIDELFFDRVQADMGKKMVSYNLFLKRIRDFSSNSLTTLCDKETNIRKRMLESPEGKFVYNNKKYLSMSQEIKKCLGEMGEIKQAELDSLIRSASKSAQSRILKEIVEKKRYYDETNPREPETVYKYLVNFIETYMQSREELISAIKEKGGAHISILYYDNRFVVCSLRSSEPFQPKRGGNDHFGLLYNASYCITNQGSFENYTDNALQIVILDYEREKSHPLSFIGFNIDKDYRFTEARGGIQDKDNNNIPGKVNKSSAGGSWEKIRKEFRGEFDTKRGLREFSKIGLPVNKIIKEIALEFQKRGVTDQVYRRENQNQDPEKILKEIIIMPQKNPEISGTELDYMLDVLKQIIIDKEELKSKIIGAIRDNKGLSTPVQLKSIEKNVEFTQEEYKQILDYTRGFAENLEKKSGNKYAALLSKDIKGQKMLSDRNFNNPLFKSLITKLQGKSGESLINPIAIIDNLILRGKTPKEKLEEALYLIFNTDFVEGDFKIDDIEKFTRESLKLHVPMGSVSRDDFLKAAEDYGGWGIICKYQIDIPEYLEIPLLLDDYDKIKKDALENIEEIRQALNKNILEEKQQLVYKGISKGFDKFIEKLDVYMKKLEPDTYGLYSIKELETLLGQAEEEENYEEAAKIKKSIESKKTK
jgi:hypothetical protein